MMVISTLGVVFRLAARFMSAAPYGADDNLIIAALVFTYGLNINEIVAVHYGLGEHQLMLNLDHIMRFLQSDWTTQLIFGCAITLTRLSLLFFYRRIFATKTFHYLSIVMGVFLIGWWISYVVAVIMSCKPVNAFWDQSIQGHCLNERTLAYGLTATELIMNIALVVMPIPWIIRLNLPREKKFAIGGVFMLGGFVLIACSLRFPFLAQFEYTDASWTIAGSGIWVNIEANVGIASVCLPVMRPLFNALHISNLRSSFSASQEKRRSLTTDTALESGVSRTSRFSSLNEKKRKRISDISIEKQKQGYNIAQQLVKAGLRSPIPEWQRPTSWLDPHTRGVTHTTITSVPAASPIVHTRPKKRRPAISETPPTRRPTPPPKDEIYLSHQRSSQQSLPTPYQPLHLPRKSAPAPLNLSHSSHSPQAQHLPATAYSPGPYRRLHSATGNYSQSARRSPSTTYPPTFRRSPSPTVTMHPTIRRISSHHHSDIPFPPTSPERRLSKIQERLTRESLRQDRAEARLAEARRVVGDQRKRSHSALEIARESHGADGGGGHRWVTATPIIQRPASLEHRQWRESRGYGVVGVASVAHHSSAQNRVRSASSQGDYSTRSGVGKRVRGDSRSGDDQGTGNRRDLVDRRREKQRIEVPEGRIGVRRSIELRRWSSQ